MSFFKDRNCYLKDYNIPLTEKILRFNYLYLIFVCLVVSMSITVLYSIAGGNTVSEGSFYPWAFKQRKFVLNKKPISIGYSPIGKNRYQYNVVAIANDNFKNWHNTYLFCLKKDKPIILLDQSKNTNPIVVQVVNDKVLNKKFKQIVE